jgi:GNAT superfamily N-acetyltransferase
MSTMIRACAARDLPAVIELMRGLADFEKLPGPDEAAAARMHRDFEARRFSVLVAEDKGRVVGYALYFFTYSTFVGRPSLYLEDLFVLPEQRGNGVGERFMRALAAEAVEQGCGRFEWTVLEWNVRAQEFYRSLGAELLHDWRVCRLDGERLAKLGG